MPTFVEGCREKERVVLKEKLLLWSHTLSNAIVVFWWGYVMRSESLWAKRSAFSQRHQFGSPDLRDPWSQHAQFSSWGSRSQLLTELVDIQTVMHRIAEIILDWEKLQEWFVFVKIRDVKLCYFHGHLIKCIETRLCFSWLNCTTNGGCFMLLANSSRKSFALIQLTSHIFHCNACTNSFLIL